MGLSEYGGTGLLFIAHKVGFECLSLSEVSLCPRITMTASPLQWCCCGGSKFTRVTTDAIGIVYSCLVSNVTYISIGLVLSCTLFLIDTFISKVLVLSCTVYLINTVSYLSLVLSCTVSYLSLVLSCTLYLGTVKTLCCFLLPSTSYACHTLSAVTSVGSAQACLS